MINQHVETNLIITNFILRIPYRLKTAYISNTQKYQG